MDAIREAISKTLSDHLQADENALQQIFSTIPKGVYFGGNKPGQAASDAGTKRKTKAPQKKRQKQGKKTNAAKVAGGTDVNDDAENDSRTALQRKLNDRIEGLRAVRKADDEASKTTRAKRKQARDSRTRSKSRDAHLSKASQQKRRKESESEEGTKGEEGADGNALQSDMPEKGAGITLETTRVSGFADENEKKPRKKRRKLGSSKMQELQNLLEEAKRDRVDFAQGDEISDPVVKEREMEKALKKAKGERMKDDVQKIAKTIRKEKRKSVKSREGWAKRVKSAELEVVARQEARETNLKNRKEAKRSGKRKDVKSKGKSKPGKHKPAKKT